MTRLRNWLSGRRLYGRLEGGDDRATGFNLSQGPVDHGPDDEANVERDVGAVHCLGNWSDHERGVHERDHRAESNDQCNQGRPSLDQSTKVHEVRKSLVGERRTHVEPVDHEDCAERGDPVRGDEKDVLESS